MNTMSIASLFKQLCALMLCIACLITGVPCALAEEDVEMSLQSIAPRSTHSSETSGLSAGELSDNLTCAESFSDLNMRQCMTYDAFFPDLRNMDVIALLHLESIGPWEYSVQNGGASYSNDTDDGVVVDCSLGTIDFQRNDIRNKVDRIASIISAYITWNNHQPAAYYQEYSLHDSILGNSLYDAWYLDALSIAQALAPDQIPDLRDARVETVKERDYLMLTFGFIVDELPVYGPMEHHLALKSMENAFAPAEQESVIMLYDAQGLCRLHARLFTFKPQNSVSILKISDAACLLAEELSKLEYREYHYTIQNARLSYLPFIEDESQLDFCLQPCWCFQLEYDRNGTSFLYTFWIDAETGDIVR